MQRASSIVFTVMSIVIRLLLSTEISAFDTVVSNLAFTDLSDTTYTIQHDWVDLYNRIAHGLLFILLRRFCTKAGMAGGLISFLVAAVELFLTENYCHFDSSIWKQTVGFATGVSAGASLAHAFLNELCSGLFERFADCIRWHRRYIDDGLMVWKGTYEQLMVWFSLMNDLAPGMRITIEASRFSAVFLDCLFYKGTRWLSTGCLDVTLYTKPVNAFLYKPFSSCAPMSQFLGVITGELRRYIKRCSSVEHYRLAAALFYDRLRARGYPPAVLRDAFRAAPSWLTRDALLRGYAKRAPADLRLHPFKMIYSKDLERLGVGRLLHRAAHLLPDHLIDSDRLVCWRAAPKLGRSLVPYTYPGGRNRNDVTPAASTGASTAASSAVSPLGGDTP